jgi:hypothetical protein
MSDEIKFKSPLSDMVYFQSEDEARFATELVLNKKGLTYDDVF